MARRELVAVLCALIAGCGEGDREPLVGARARLEQSRSLVGLDDAFARGFRGQGVTVATLDTGLDATHADLAGALVAEACFCASNCCPGTLPDLTGAGSASDDHGHGTHIAGVIASRGVLGPRGGAPEASVLAVKVLDASNSFCCVSDLVAALDWIGANHPEVRVINMSLAFSTLYAGSCDAADANTIALAAAIQARRAQGMLVVAPAGNQGVTGLIAAPACIESVFAVGAVWDDDLGMQTTTCTDAVTGPDQIACFSNVSSALDVLAPGTPVTASWPNAMTRTTAGTSEAAAVVSACAAVVLSAAPTLSVTELEGVLRASGPQLLDARVGSSFPRIDCSAAIDAAIALNEDAGLIPVSDAGEDGATPPGPDAALDASAAMDAAVDAALTFLDAAASDASVLPDASSGVDAGAMDASVDAAPPVALPTSNPADLVNRGADANGCTCNNVGHDAGTSRPWLLAGALLVYWQSRRWRTKRSLPVPSKKAIRI